MHSVVPLNQQVAELAVSYVTAIPAHKRVTVNRSLTAVEVFRYFWSIDTLELQESFKVMLLNRANQVLGIMHLANGGLSSTVVDVRILFASAIKSLASGIILCHNHPSGNVQPSAADKKLTTTIAEIATLFEITLLDHLILTKDDYFSFSDEGLLLNVSPQKDTYENTSHL